MFQTTTEIFISAAYKLLFIIGMNNDLILTLMLINSILQLMQPTNSAIVLFVSVVVSMEINRRHYFWVQPTYKSAVSVLSNITSIWQLKNTQVKAVEPEHSLFVHQCKGCTADSYSCHFWLLSAVRRMKGVCLN